MAHCMVVRGLGDLAAAVGIGDESRDAGGEGFGRIGNPGAPASAGSGCPSKLPLPGRPFSP